MRPSPTGISLSYGTSAQRMSGVANNIHREPKAMRGNARTTGAAMTDASKKPSAYNAAHFNLEHSVIGEEALYISAKKCWKGVNHKHSAQSYILNIIERTVTLAKRLAKGTYSPGPTHIVKITYPKPRTAVAIGFRDRVYQRSLNDNAIYPQMTRSFVYANCACQRGKGTDTARNLFKSMLHRAYLKYGTNDFAILSGDVKGYYDSMRHDISNQMFKRSCDSWTAKRVVETLDRQYKGENGYNPGSQMVQIAGISYLNCVDHYIKEVLRVKLYVRYMDDFHVIERDVETLESFRAKISEKMSEIGMMLHPKKTQIVSASKGVVFLGYHFRVTETGKVLMFRDRKRVKEIRRRMIRLAHRIGRGDTRREALAESYQCVRASLEKGNSRGLLRRMDIFYNNLETEIDNERRHREIAQGETSR